MRAEALVILNLADQDFGPCVGDEFSHAEFADAWRGPRACPTEAAIQAAASQAQSKADAEVKKAILQEALEKRDELLHHLTWFYLKAWKANNVLAMEAMEVTRASLESFMADPRIVNAVDGATRNAVFLVYYDIFNVLKADHRPTYDAMKALGSL